MPVLQRIAEGKAHPDLLPRLARLEQFLDDTQAIVSPTSRFRVLDSAGNNLVAANTSRIADLDAAESSEGEGYGIDAVLDRELFRNLVAGLLPGEVRYILDPRASVDPATLEPVALYDMILALGDAQRAVGYIAAKVRYQPIDRLLNVSPRLHNGNRSFFPIRIGC